MMTAHDVAVIGADFSGLMLAAILARHGVRVAIVDDGTLPRYAIGEVTIPYTSVIIELIGDRYDVPEISQIAYAHKVAAKVSNTCGVKKNLGFLYHREGRLHDPDEAIQFNVPSEHGESHFFRQDIDAYLLQTALKYGATAYLGTKIDDLDTDGSGATVSLADGRAIKAGFIVDSSGERSLLAAKHDLRESPTRLKHHCRSMHTHMIGVRKWDDLRVRSKIKSARPRTESAIRKRLEKVRAVGKVEEGLGALGITNPGVWSEGTLHHVFDGGWLGVAHFGNHDSAKNPLTSVMLHLDPRKFPDDGTPAAEEFARFIRQFPGIASQFDRAKTVRPWLKKGRVQYSSKKTIGERFVLFDTSASYGDLLYARALCNAAEYVYTLAWPLIEAARAKDYSMARFEYFDSVQQGVADWNDRVHHAAYLASRDFSLWNAFGRCWLLTSMLCTLAVRSRHKKWMKTKDESHLRELMAPAKGGYWYPLIEPIRDLFDTVVADVNSIETEHAFPADITAKIYGYLSEGGFVPPAFDFADPDARIYNFNLPRQLRTAWWLFTAAPDEFRDIAK